MKFPYLRRKRQDNRLSASLPSIVSIVGPTASGKSALAVALAERFSGEVVSADSRQIYRELSIGTAKITEAEMKGIPHHLIDIRSVDESYSAKAFFTEATAAITEIQQRNKLPIICGGTFFYVDTLLYHTTIPEVPPNDDLRASLATKDADTLFAALEKLDPARAATIDPENKRRLIRALEIVSAQGAVPTPTPKQLRYPVLQIGLRVPKEALLERYAVRAKEWLSRGLLDEVARVLKNGTTRERLTEIGFEYTLALSLLDGNITHEEFIQRFVEKNWQYAKRQYTWLKRNQDIQWFDPTEQETIFSTVSSFLSD